jgi:hypothetical protein
MDCAIFILTQNTEIRKVYLKTTLYFLFRHFNAEFKYPVVIFHEGDYDADSQTEILQGIRESCRSLVSFRALDAGDFSVPEHIDKDKLKRCIETKPVPYWRNEAYRNMCRWWVVHVHKYAKGYTYIMRIDDDAIIEEPIPDLFEWAKNKNFVYASNMLHTDCGICNYGMRQFFEKRYPEKKDLLGKLFVQQQLPSRAVKVHPFRTLLSITQQDTLPNIGETITIDMPTILYNNFFITKTSFWQREDVKALVDEVDKDGSIYYFRWGDAPLHTLIVNMLASPDEIARSVFKYSKRLQRESFKGNDKVYYSYMPLTYDKSSCASETQ